MAHIASFMVESGSSVGLNNMIARELSPDSSSSANSSRVNLSDMSTYSSSPKEEKEKYVWRLHQPSESRRFNLFPSKEKPSSISTVRKPSIPESVTLGDAKSNLRSKSKEQPLGRRRKISVPELGPMTTVQEVPMDSPTIPGRPPLHERSISAPANSWARHVYGESMLSCIEGPTLEESLEMIEAQAEELGRYGSKSPRLAPLNTSQGSLVHSRRSNSSSPLPPDVPPKSARMQNASPHPRGVCTPSSSATTLVETPLASAEGRDSPDLSSWGIPTIQMGHSRGQSENTPQHVSHAGLGHRRGESDSSVSIMNRGRPKKRAPDGSPIKRAPRKRSPSVEQDEFDTLPQGYRAAKAASTMASPELETLRRQAMGQAAKFEVLPTKDVEALSRELRALDERCDYLRKTHKSLRSGRRNLHERICSYLRSPRVARFSHESILKQEEALAELDSSIDDWVAKLEYAENRRTRIRQKLLEHVAAALILPPSEEEPPCSPFPACTINTPPRSPTKSQSPQRLAEPIKASTPEPMSRKDVQSMASMASIKIYADSDVYALLADVEEEISRMGEQSEDRFTSASSIRAPEQPQPSREASPPPSDGPLLNAMTFQGTYTRNAQHA
ncbi:hypothetical protein BP6252_04658 [Coleophoma cylindrospora]|uniref:Up-regulated during septation protein 1 domain-containing protein n=1 Tax=Coleophoma cylindrospora TaxID=1849047 RepID=A0A3D8S1K3_9HELO|nr:hypothetical protein BP6252_04658 [Coleophoma cylindrospora]